MSVAKNHGGRAIVGDSYYNERVELLVDKLDTLPEVPEEDPVEG